MYAQSPPVSIKGQSRGGIYAPDELGQGYRRPRPAFWQGRTSCIRRAATPVLASLSGCRRPSMHRRFMRRLAHCVLPALLVGCATAPAASRPAAAAVDSRSPLVRMADSTRILISTAAYVSDTANVHAHVALAESQAERARSRVRDARTAADNAIRLVDAAILQGDYISEALPDASGARAQSANFTRYWLMGREKLTLARARSTSAAEAAGRILECTAPDCATTRTRELQGYAEQAAGASREAEVLVRIAMVYVDMAMSYVR